MLASFARFHLSFTSASLRTELLLVLVAAYNEQGDWGAVRASVLANNSLQCRSSASAGRLERELRNRLQTLTPTQLSLITKLPADARAQLAWLAAVKHSAFLFAFASEVLREKVAMQDFVLRPSDYQKFWDEKCPQHPELSALTSSSRSKIRQVCLRMLSEVGILSKTPGDLGLISLPVLHPEVKFSIRQDSPHWLAAFLVQTGDF